MVIIAWHKQNLRRKQKYLSEVGKNVKDNQNVAEIIRIEKQFKDSKESYLLNKLRKNFEYYLFKKACKIKKYNL